MELYPTDRNGYTASPLHTPSAHPDSTLYPSNPALISPHQSRQPAAPPPTMLPPVSSIPPPPLSLVQQRQIPATIDRPRAPPNTLRPVENETDEDEDDDGVFAPAVSSMVSPALATIVPPPKPKRPPPQRSTVAPAQKLASLNLYADDNDEEEAPPPPPPPPRS